MPIMPTMSQKAPKRLAFPRNPAFMVLLCSVAACLLATLMIMTRPVASFVVQQQQRRGGSGTGTAASGGAGVTPCSNSKKYHHRLYMSSSAPQEPTPSTFREAEVLGLKLMQEGDYEMALQGMYVCVCVHAVFVRRIILSWTTMSMLLPCWPGRW